MKVRRVALVVFGALVVLGVGFSAYALLTVGDGREANAPQPSVAGAPASIKEPLARGEYLARAADCIACHTLPGEQPFSGGLAFKTPFGTIYSSNITADKDTGIGAWSDDDFVRALHAGVGKNREPLYPAFPYASYTALSRDDIPGHQGLFVQLTDRVCAGEAKRIAVPFQPTLGFELLERFVLAQGALSTDAGQIRCVESRCLSRYGARPLQ